MSRVRLCKRCGNSGEHKKSRNKGSRYCGHYLCTGCTIIVNHIVKNRRNHGKSASPKNG
jgi:hypothetical protein